MINVGGSKNLTQTILNLANIATEFPLIITNKDFPIIRESAYIISALEDAGFKVKTFSKTGEYGIEVSK